MSDMGLLVTDLGSQEKQEKMKLLRGSLLRDFVKINERDFVKLSTL